jgi:hypothetical protein
MWFVVVVWVHVTEYGVSSPCITICVGVKETLLDNNLERFGVVGQWSLRPIAPFAASAASASRRSGCWRDGAVSVYSL